VPIVFKGSGFYCTDHGSSTRHNPGPKYEDVEAKDEPKSEAKADTKSATKAESKSGKSD
jgi:predicted nucleic acid-binding Zn ribbon protein